MISGVKLNSELYPIIIKGGSKAITRVKFNKDGDLLFVSSQDEHPIMYRAQTGELIGTYDGHGAAVWDIAPNKDTTFVATAAADQTARIFHATTGTLLSELTLRFYIAKAVSWADESNRLATMCGQSGKGGKGSIEIFDLPEEYEEGNFEARQRGEISIEEDIPTCVRWVSGDSLLAVGFESGKISLYDTDSLEEVFFSMVHNGAVTDLSLDVTGNILVSSSKDCTACILEPSTLQIVKTFRVRRPVNGAALSPLHPHIILGGGQEAMEVTVTRGDSGMFESRIFHAIYGDEIAIIPGHFGPIQTLDVHPTGRLFATGAQDGYVRVHIFDDAYVSLPHDYVEYMN
jgi:translation initiation factor 3 subunit I